MYVHSVDSTFHLWECLFSVLLWHRGGDRGQVRPAGVPCDGNEWSVNLTSGIPPDGTDRGRTGSTRELRRYSLELALRPS